MHAMDFVDRSEELAALQRRWDRGRAELVIVWGRRRVGKTELLNRFLAGKTGLLYEAAEGSTLDQLHDLSTELGRAARNPLLLQQPLTSWPAVLTAVDQWAAQSGRVVVVLDEFQRLAKRAPELGALLSRWWRERGRSQAVFLVLSGSEVSFFQREVLAQPATLYGRRTGQLQVTPLSYRDAGRFFPQWSAADRLRAYAICGGMPYYLEAFDARADVRANILAAVLRRDGLLREEARLLLHEELSEPDSCFSVLRALANGSTRVAQLINATGIEKRSMLRILDVLTRLFLVQRDVPVGASQGQQTRNTSYSIADEYLHFWFTFVHPYLSTLERGDRIEMHLDEVVMPRLDEFVSAPAFERACHQYVASAEHGAAAVGRWWGQIPDPARPRRTVSRELDVVAADARGDVLAVGCCKWTNRKLGVAEDELITTVAASIPRARGAFHRYFFSREGFSEELRRRAEAEPERYRLVAPEAMYEAVLTAPR